MPLSSQDVLKAFDRIRVFQRGEQRAVHKPLLILMALARIAHMGTLSYYEARQLPELMYQARQ